MKIFANQKLKLPFPIFLLILFLIILSLFFDQKNRIKENIQESHLKFPIVSGVTPHHLLAEKIIEDFFSYISSKEKPETIVLLGPDHFNAGAIVGNSFITLQPETQEFFEIKVDNSLIKKLSFANNLIFSNSSISFDHGITNLVPFIKKYFPNSKIAPFIIPGNVSQKELDQFVNSLSSFSPFQTVVIASVDFSHDLPNLAAKFHDAKSIRTLINFEKENFKNLDVDCWQALYVARAFAHLRNKEFPKIINHLNSQDFLQNENLEKTTSYFSLIFEEGNWQKENLSGKTILFIGDIMLDRGVEYLMRKNSVFYPFKKINQFLRGIDIVVGNLEGPIVENHQNFSDQSLKFAFSPNVIDGLSFANFNLLSLANNHTFDVGEKGFEETKKFLKENGISPIGHPIDCEKEFLFETEEMVFLAFNKTFPFNCSDDKIVRIVKEVRDSNSEKFLIVLFHWGEEYQSKSSIFQQKLAHRTIDAGADLIIGSHPHVVQEIEEYKGKLIFYSLGNFIFDQYFSKETQEGLAVGFEIYPEKVIYRLFPIQSHLSQPFLMEQERAKEFLEKLSKKSSPQLDDKIKNGIIEIER